MVSKDELKLTLSLMSLPELMKLRQKLVFQKRTNLQGPARKTTVFMLDCVLEVIKDKEKERFRPK